MTDQKEKPTEESVQVLHEFKCSSCNINEKAHYKGTNPPFSRNIVLKYPSYVMKDPFSPPGKGEILVLGADCNICEKSVCISKNCSIFYHKTYCLDCAYQNVDSFPIEIKNKVQCQRGNYDFVLFSHKEPLAYFLFTRQVTGIMTCLDGNFCG